MGIGVGLKWDDMSAEQQAEHIREEEAWQARIEAENKAQHEQLLKECAYIDDDGNNYPMREIIKGDSCVLCVDYDKNGCYIGSNKTIKAPSVNPDKLREWIHDGLIDINHKNKNGDTLLHIIVKHSKSKHHYMGHLGPSYKPCPVYLVHGAWWNFFLEIASDQLYNKNFSVDGSPMDYLYEYGDVKQMYYLQKKYPVPHDLDFTDNKFCKALFWIFKNIPSVKNLDDIALMPDDIDVLDTIFDYIKEKYDINITDVDKNGRGFLTYSVLGNFIGLTYYLSKIKGLDCNIKDDDIKYGWNGYSPKDYAKLCFQFRDLEIFDKKE